MSENWTKNDSKWPLGGYLGPLLEALGAMWVPRGAQYKKRTKKNLARPFFRVTFWYIFAYFSYFCALWDMLFAGLRFYTIWALDLHGFGHHFKRFFVSNFTSFSSQTWKRKM